MFRHVASFEAVRVRTVRRFIGGLVLVGVFGAALPCVADENVPLDWSAWRTIPVLHDGRMMPLDTFARTAADIICDRMAPTIDLAAEIPADELKSSDYDEARQLFPDGKPRKFDAVELLFSWMVEPEKWEEVPFLRAEHDELREKYLGVPVKNAKGEHLDYVSPRQVRDAVELHARREELANEQRQAMVAKREFAVTGVDQKISDLWKAYSLYRKLTHRPTTVVTLAEMPEIQPSSRYMEQLDAVVRGWQTLRDSVHPFSTMAAGTPLGELPGQIQSSLEILVQTANTAGIAVEDLEPKLAELAAKSDELDKVAHAIRGWLEEGMNQLEDDHRARTASTIRGLVAESRKFKKSVHELHLSLYDNGDSLRVVPALNPFALEKERPQEDDSQPWINLNTVLYASDDVLAGYPAAKVKAVRDAHDHMVASYAAWQQIPSRKASDDFSAATRAFSQSLRALGEAIEPARRALPIADVDADLLAHTQYPPPGSTAVEVSYNRVQPFLGSWLIGGLSLLCFCLAFGVLRRPMFWLGMAVLLVAVVWTIYGFSMRVRITGWAPVTNMYETVIFVPTVVALLGAWFALLPVTWNGIKSAWRLTAIPGTPEARDLTTEQAAILPRRWWLPTSAVLAVPRIALALLVFMTLVGASSGGFYPEGEAIIKLTPVVDAGHSLPSANGLMAWMAGIACLGLFVWGLPRLLFTGLASVILIPRSIAVRSRDDNRAAIAHVYARWPFAFSAALGLTFFTLVAWWAPIPGKNIEPLQPVLRDNFWLTIHVLTIVTSYGAGMLACILGAIALCYYLFGTYRNPHPEVALAAGHRPAGDAPHAPELGRRPPEACATLAGYVYRATQVAVLLLVTGTILGGLWADVSWGRFWGWDPKEVWALISGLVYLAILHGRYAGWFGNFGLCFGSVLGSSAIAFSWYGVNFVLGAGLHTYGFGKGGQYEVGALVACLWVLGIAAGVRYYLATSVAVEAAPGTDGETLASPA